MKIHGTAKGGALGKKDFGVAFSSGGGGTNTTYTQALSNNQSDPNSSSIISEKIINSDSVFYNVAIVDVQFYIYNHYETTGTVTCGLFASDGTLKHTFWTMDIASLPTSADGLQQGTMSAYTSATIAGDCIGIKTDSANKVKMLVQLTDVFDGVNTAWANNGTEETDYDCAFSITVNDSPT